MGEYSVVSIAVSLVAVMGTIWVWIVLYWIWWKPIKLERELRQQGIRGPSYKLYYGNQKESSSMTKESLSKPINLSHNIVPRVVPYVHQIVKSYGKMSVIWYGTTPRVNIMDPDLIRDVLSNKFGHFAKIKLNPLTRLLANGFANCEGEHWAKHRRIIHPAFHQQKLKRMLPSFYISCDEFVNKWKKLVETEGSYELDVWSELQNLTGDVISRIAFGSSFEEGRRIFQLQIEQAELAMQVFQSTYIPGMSFLPTKRNNRMKEISREVGGLVRDMIKKREKAIKSGEATNDDVLGLLIESNIKEIKEHGNSNKKVGMSIEEIIEECKLFYFAGQETTSVLLVWTMVVLSMHQDWQARAREEVLEVFGQRKPHFDGLNQLKIVNMIFYEVLRLYPPLILIVRRSYKKMKLREISLPPGVEIGFSPLLVHHDHDLWGEDANKFNPERFAEGVSKATKNQVSFFPFGWGPRTCIGQNFSMLEAKIALTMILQNFSFELSPTYVHAPNTVVTLQPQHGAPIILHKL